MRDLFGRVKSRIGEGANHTNVAAYKPFRRAASTACQHAEDVRQDHSSGRTPGETAIYVLLRVGRPPGLPG